MSQEPPDWWRLAASMRVLARLSSERLQKIRDRVEEKAETCLAMSSRELGAGGDGAGQPGEAERGAVSAAVEVLGNLAEENDARFLERAAGWLRDGDWSIRSAAAIGLGRVGACDCSAAELLVEALKDQDDGVRASAARAIAEATRHPPREKTRGSDPDAAARVAAVLVEQLVNTVQDAEPWVRLWSRAALSGCVRLAVRSSSSDPAAEESAVGDATGAVTGLAKRWADASPQTAHRHVVVCAAERACDDEADVRDAAREALEHAGLLLRRDALGEVGEERRRGRGVRVGGEVEREGREAFDALR